MIAILILALLGLCVAAPWLGTDTTDARSEHARPDQGWFPTLPNR